ncbi:hypothetical protein MO867_19140 [Microbulbifer sp. OS29]|uniref:Terminase n=1 Tax=Microbulbifer okhotskensis TaxID=2926617 RepID=A0A9X2EQC8_9GAMM|nr:hypothetical protein [Microbulbifer okhotskensis]MCO1336452.1 hypothetical protein [Microbulbifer okhotskensis]
MARRTSYKEEFAEQAEKLCKLGLTDKELGEFFEVTEQTINNWKNKHPEFFESIKRGKNLADANVAESLFRRACGYSHEAVKIMQHNGNPIVQEYTEHYPPDTTACLAWLHNRQREKWQRNPDPAGGGADIPPTKVVFEVKDARTREGSESGT